MFSTAKFWIWFLFAIPVVFQGWYAYTDHFLFPGQVTETRGRGLPFICHGGMWSDIVIFAPLMAYLISTHGGEWGRSIVVAFIIGAALSYAMHFHAYVPGARAVPEAHTHDGWLTVAGWIHLIYMAVGIAIIALFYFDTTTVRTVEMWTISGLLFVHVIVGTHVPFKAWVKWTEPSWYPIGPVFDLPTVITLAGTATALTGLSFWALRH